MSPDERSDSQARCCSGSGSSLLALSPAARRHVYHIHIIYNKIRIYINDCVLGRWTIKEEGQSWKMDYQISWDRLENFAKITEVVFGLLILNRQ